MTKPDKAISLWLYTCCFMVFAMMVIGAITRLTESGLSMVEWRPLIGALPPLSEEEWHRVFGLYKTSPEFQKVNMWMELSDFKRIFFWEWLHRLWGRLIGLVYAIPMIIFWLKGYFPKKEKIRFTAFLILGASQGFLGWYMVQSGLINNPAVSHFRLAAHLSVAMVLYILLLNTALIYSQNTLPKPLNYHKYAKIHFWFICLCVATTILFGAFTAGMDAGLIYNHEFPKMGGQWIPVEAQSLPDLVKYPAPIQWTHRWLAIFTAANTLAFCLHLWWRKQTGKTTLILAAIVTIQFMLGIATLMSGVNIALAALHQTGAIALITILMIIFRGQVAKP